MKLKKLLASILCVAMVLSTMSFTAFAAETTVSTAEDFYNAVKNASSEDVVNLDEDITYDTWNSIWNKENLTINGNGNTITVNAVDSGINGGGLFLNASNLTINDLTVVLPTETTGERERLAIMSGTLNNVTVIGGVHGVSAMGDLTIKNCTFEGQSEWTVETEYNPTSLTITDSTFEDSAVILRSGNNTFTGNKIANEGEGVNVLGDAVISGNDFGESTLGIDRGVTVTVENNIINNVELSTWLEGDYSAVTVESNTLSGAALETLQTVDETVESVAYVAKIGNTPYYTLNDALASAVDGDTIAIYEDINGNIPGTTLDNITFKAEGDVEVSGKVILGGTGTADVAEGTLTFDGFTFTGTQDIINAHDGNEKLGELDIVVKNCKFPDAQKTVVLMPGWASSLEAPKSVTIDNCEFTTTTYVGETVSLQKVAKAVVKNSTFTCTDTTNEKSLAMNFTYSVSDVTVENNEVTGYGRGVGLGMNMIPEGTNATVVIDKNEIEATIAIEAHGNLANQQAGGSVAPITVTNNTITAETAINNRTDELITDIVDAATLTGNTVNEEAWTDVKENTTSTAVPTAKIGEKEYKSLEAALAAAQANNTITLVADTEISEATAFDKAVTIDLDNNTLDMTASHGEFSPSEKRITAYYITAPVTIQNGTVNVSNDVVPTGMDHGLFFVVTPGTLTFNNVELNSNGFASYAMFGTYGELEFNNSTVNVTGNAGSERVIYSEEPGSLDVVASSITATDIEVYGIEMWAPYTVDENSTINTTFYVKPTETNITNEVKLAFEATDDQRVYNIYVEATEAGKTINRLSTVQGTFELDNDRMSYALAPVDGVTLTNDIDTENVYVFNFDGENAPDASGAKILIGTVTFGGYGEFNFTVTDGKVKTALLEDNIVSEYIPNGDTTGENAKQGNLDLNESVITGAEVVEAKREVKVVIDYNNDITAGNEADYNDMWVTITGSNGEEWIGYVGSAPADDAADDNVLYFDNTAEKAEMTFNVTAGYRYTVVVKGEGYRTARYSTTVDAADNALVLNFWNNAKDEVEFIEEGIERSQKTVTFLAGDIAQDNIIDKYDLAAVVSYFGFDNLKTTNPDYVKYDLNRDGKIDADDISYVLVSWDK